MELDFDPMESLTIGITKTNISDGYVGNGPNGTIQYGIPNGVGSVTGEHSYGEHPSKTLLVRNINSNVEDSELQSLFEIRIGGRANLENEKTARLDMSVDSKDDPLDGSE